MAQTTFSANTVIRSAEVNQNFLEKQMRTYATVATAAGTTVLTFDSAFYQIFTGTTTQTVTLPVASTMPIAGAGFRIINDSTGAITVNSSGGNLVVTVYPGTECEVRCILLSGTSAASWQNEKRLPFTTIGDILYASTAGLPARLAGAAGVLQGQVAGAPSFTQAPTLTTPSMATPVVSTQIDLTGGQIKFPATQVASSNANTLDDYEEGTFSPTIIGTGVAGAGTYTTQVGMYTKVGRQVSIQVYVLWSAHTGTGSMQMSNLPFTVNTTASSFSTAPVILNNVALTAGNVAVGYFTPNTVKIDLNQTPTGGGALASINIDTTGTLIASGTYFID